MANYEFISNLYYQYELLTKSYVSDRINEILDHFSGSLDKYSIDESSFFNISSVHKEVIAQIASGYPTYTRGKLFLSNKKKEVLVELSYEYNRLFYITIHSQSQNVNFSELIMSQKNNHLVFASQDSFKKFEQKHKLIEEEDGYVTESFLGHSFEKGIPGTYRITYFREDLFKDCAQFLENFDSVKNTSHGRLCSLDESSSKVFSIPSNDYFFDINSPEKLLRCPPSLQEYFERLELQHPRSIPHVLTVPKIGNIVEIDIEFSNSSEIDSTLEQIDSKIFIDYLNYSKSIKTYFTEKYSKKTLDENIIFSVKGVDGVIEYKFNILNAIYLSSIGQLKFVDLEKRLDSLNKGILIS